MHVNTILVTGHNGYVGSALVPLLLDAGHDVIGADLGWFDERSEASNQHGASDFRALTLDELSRFDAVIHLAGLADDALCDAFPDDAVEVNVRATVALAERAQAAGVGRFVLASSSAVYGTTDAIASEDDPPAPVSLYAETKLEAETRLLALHQPGFAVACLRFGSGYGVSPKMRSDLVLNKLTTIAADRGEIALATQGDCYRPFIHVRDMARALAHAATASDVTAEHQVFNVVEPTGNTTVRAAVDLLAEAAGARVLPEGDKVDPRSYRIDPARFMATGFSYEWPLADGLSHLARSNRYEAACGSLDRLTDRVAMVRDADALAADSDTVGSVSPARLDPAAERRFLADAARIVSTSSYRHGGGHSDEAGRLVAEEFAVTADQRVLMTRSGTDALVRALQALGVSGSDRVIVPDQAFHAVASSVRLLGALPVYADICPDDFNLDPAAVDAALTSESAAAVIAVDNYGTPADWAALGAVCRRHQVPLIVDACESLGASRPDQRVSEHADVIVVSFSFTKPVHAAGMGGAIIGPSALIDDVEQRPEWLYRQIRLPELNAAYLVRAWPSLPTNIERLRAIYDRYADAVADLGFTPQVEHGRSTRIHAPFLVPTGWNIDARDQLLKLLNDRGVNALAQFPTQSRLLGIWAESADCPVAADVGNSVVALPSGSALPLDQVDRVIDIVRSTVAAF